MHGPLYLIHASLINGTCTALGCTGRGHAPVLDLCRQLQRFGHDQARLHVYRGDTLSLIVRSIGEGARLSIAGDGVGFRPVCEPVGAPPMRQNRTSGVAT